MYMIRIFTFVKITLQNPNTEIYIISAMAGFFAGIQNLLIILGLLVFIDLITGIRKSRKMGIRCTWSNGYRRTWEKVGGYGIIIVTFALIDKLLLIEQGVFVMTAAKTAAFLIAVTEAKSITENISITMGDSLATRIFQAINKAFKDKIVSPSVYDEMKEREDDLGKRMDKKAKKCMEDIKDEGTGTE